MCCVCRCFLPAVSSVVMPTSVVPRVCPSAELKHQGLGGGSGLSLEGPHLHGHLLLWQRVEEKRRPGAVEPSVGTRVYVTMAWTPLLLMLLSHCTGSLSQPVVTQPSSFSASLGTTARLTCTLSSGFNVGSYSITWFQ
uniref:Ig-like domain-containing protein n=1 Tax=Suricata suricatta TaxID=37032 RepID=A0A673UWJ0_SURSU